MTNVSYQETSTVRLVKHILNYWEALQTEALLLWMSVSTKLTWTTRQLVQNILNTSEKTSTVIMLITELVLLTGLTKLPVADCPKCRCSPFCLGLQLQSCSFLCLGWWSPGLNVWTPEWSRIPVNTLVFMYVSWLN